MSKLLSCDPGISGGLAFFEDGKLTRLEYMPNVDTGKGKRIDISHFCSMLKDIDECVMEDVHSIIHMGKASSWRMGYGVGLLHGALSALKIPLHRVTPQKWKAHFQLLKKTKDASRLLAMEMCPEFQSRFSKVKDDGVAESYLIGQYYLLSRKGL